MSSKIAVLSVWDKNTAELAEIVAPNKREYCLRHGYDYVAITSGFDHDRTTHWSKIKSAASILKNYQWVFYSDIDSLIMNQNIKLESFIDFNYEFIISYDRFGINSGQWLIRRGPWAFNFLNSVYSQTQFIGQPCEEQNALIHVLMMLGENIKRTKLVCQKAFNSYLYENYDWKWEPGQYTTGDFMLHLPGMSNEQRIPILKEYIEKVLK